MRRLGWFEWLYLQVAFPLAAGIMIGAVAGIPFVYVWPPMSMQNAWFMLGVGTLYALVSAIAQHRKFRKDGLVPPF
jgi:ABC-type transport system involved in cytochrome bd biosynthesis fused ATPase/permease subunit